MISSSVDYMAEEVRIEKMNRLRDHKINPYPYSYKQTNHALDIKENYESMENEKASVAGRIIGLREMGKLQFCDMLDSTGKIQLLVKADSLDESSKKVLENLDIGDIVGAEGKVTKTKKGEVSIDVSNITMLAKSLRTLPEKFHGLKDIETRYRKRYLDLISNPDIRKIFVARSKIISHFRRFFDERGYIEVETPVLQPVYGGAAAKPFLTHHNFLDMDIYMRISMELYLKRLIIGGIERVYEIGKDFRNEAADSTHNPEFTQIEAYEAYADYNDYMKMTEELISGTVKELTGDFAIEYQGKKVDFKPPFKRVSIVDSIKEKSGIDISNMSDDEAAAIAKKEKLDIPIKNNIHVADALFDKYVKDGLEQPSFVVDHPAYMCPLTKDKRGNKHLSERFELFIATKECANCYSELTDPIEQRKKFEDQDKERIQGDFEANPIDEDFLEAIEYGMPPTAGIGIGIDRIVMLLTNNISLKEVMLFPATKPE